MTGGTCGVNNTEEQVRQDTVSNISACIDPALQGTSVGEQAVRTPMMTFSLRVSSICMAGSVFLFIKAQQIVFTADDKLLYTIFLKAYAYMFPKSALKNSVPDTCIRCDYCTASVVVRDECEMESKRIRRYYVAE